MIIRHRLLNMRGLPGNNTSPVDLKPKLQGSFHQATDFLKYYLCEAAFSLVRCDKEYSDFYHLKYKEVNRCQHKRALALTARKFVRLVFRLLKDNRLYCPAK